MSSTNKLYLYAPIGASVDKDTVQRLLTEEWAMHHPLRQNASRTMDIYEWQRELSLSSKERYGLLQTLLPIARSMGYAFCLRIADAEPIKRIVADLDGTLVADELLVALMRVQDTKAEMRQETEKAMNGDSPFESSFRQRALHLRGITATKLEEIAYELPLAKGAELLCYFAQGEDIRLDIASSNLSPYVHNLCLRLSANEYIATMPLLEEDDETLSGNLSADIIGATEKRAFAISDPHLQVSAQATLTIGDGANDLEMLSATSHALLYSAVHPQALNIAHITTDVYFQ